MHEDADSRYVLHYIYYTVKACCRRERDRVEKKPEGKERKLPSEQERAREKGKAKDKGPASFYLVDVKYRYL